MVNEGWFINANDVYDYLMKNASMDSQPRAIRRAAKMVIEFPAADVVPVRRGHWVKMTGMMPPEFTGHYECSECRWFCKKHGVKETDFDFCPGCGADMRVEVKNEGQ